MQYPAGLQVRYSVSGRIVVQICIIRPDFTSDIRYLAEYLIQCPAFAGYPVSRLAKIRIRLYPVNLIYGPSPAVGEIAIRKITVLLKYNRSELSGNNIKIT